MWRLAHVLVMVSGAAFAAAAASPEASASAIPPSASQRIAGTLIELLKQPGRSANPLLTALSERRADVLGSDDRFWAEISKEILDDPAVAGALRDRASRSDESEVAELALLTRELPEVADALAAGVDTGSPARRLDDQVLRRVSRPGPSVQSLIVARAIDPKNDRSDEFVDRILAVPADFAASKAEFEAMRHSLEPKRWSLGFRYGVATGARFADEELDRALASSDPALVRAALSVLDASSAERAGRFEARLLALVQGLDEPEVLFSAVRTTGRAALAETEAALTARGSRAGFWTSEAGLSAFAALAELPGEPASLVRNAHGIPLREMAATGDCRVIPAVLAAETTTSDGEEAAADAFVAMRDSLAPNAHLGCVADAFAAALDAAFARARDTGFDSGAISAEFARMASIPNENARPSDEVIQALAAALQAARGARNALLADLDGIEKLTLADTAHADPLLTALLMSLPPDHPFLARLRAAITPEAGESLEDHVGGRSRALSRILPIVGSSSGWNGGELDALSALARMDSVGLAAPAFEALVRDGDRARLLAYFDWVAGNLPGGSQAPSLALLRAVRAFEAAARSPDAPSVYTPERVDWLLSRLQDPGLRGRVIRVLGRRPVGAPIDVARLTPLIARAATSDGGQAAGTCLDLATLGPFRELDLALTTLDAASALKYEGEPWPEVCARLIGPSDQGRLTQEGELIAKLVAQRPKAADDEAGASKDLATFAGLWDGRLGKPLSSFARQRVADSVVEDARLLGWSVGAVLDLRGWDKRLGADFPQAASSVRSLWLRRGALLLAVAVPVAVASHLLFWVVLLIGYPRSLRLRTHVFYNPLARKILGASYVDFILVWVAPIRRRLFEPFRAALLGDFDRIGPQRGAYYPDSEVCELKRVDLERAIRDVERTALAIEARAGRKASAAAFAGWRGPTWLFGPSGRGKTSFLRHLLTSSGARFPFAYLKASDCGDDVLKALCDRLGGLGQDRDLVTSLVHAGLLDLYIDGVNEVDRERQETIVRFIVDHRDANIFVTSQEVGISLPSKLATLYLLPLSRPQMKAFIAGREPSLPDQAPLRGDLFRARAEAFIDEIVASADAPPVEVGEAQRTAALATSFVATLANPLDLETAATLLSLDIDPDPFRLQEQQYQLVSQDYQTRMEREFPIEDLSRAVLSARRENRIELDPEVFAQAVAVLEERKQVRRVNIPVAGGKSATEYRFRHDKIRDFYTHFAVLSDEQARFDLARDDRFAGVYDYLARKLSDADIVELRDYLLSSALDSNDHRLSDRFLQHLRWRSLLSEAEPTWVEAYDPPRVRDALLRFGELDGERQAIERGMSAIREEVERSRRTLRILASKNAEGLEAGLTELFGAFGATVKPTEGGEASSFDVPGHGPFRVFCLAGARCAAPFTLAGIAARAGKVQGRKVAVVNPSPELQPQARDWSIVGEVAERLRDQAVVVRSSLDVHAVASRDDGNAFWRFMLDLTDPSTTPDREMAIDAGAVR